MNGIFLSLVTVDFVTSYCEVDLLSLHTPSFVVNGDGAVILVVVTALLALLSSSV